MLLVGIGFFIFGGYQQEFISCNGIPYVINSVTHNLGPFLL